MTYFQSQVSSTRLHELSLIFLQPTSCIGATGSAVAVERIFSGGRDTISLRRASLKPETIRILMLVKRKLILARTHPSGLTAV